MGWKVIIITKYVATVFSIAGILPIAVIVLTYLGGDCDESEFCLSSCRNLAKGDIGLGALEATVLVVTATKHARDQYAGTAKR